MRWQEAQMAFTAHYKQRCGGGRHSLPIISKGELVVATLVGQKEGPITSKGGVMVGA